MLTPDSRAILGRLMAFRPTSEWCGFLAEALDGSQRLLALRNLARGGEFVIDPEDRTRVLAEMASAGLVPVAFLHTHRRRLEMSPADVTLFASDELPWVIAMLVDGRVEARTYLRPDPDWRGPQ